MSNPSASVVAIIDYGMGNLFSVTQACEQAGLQTVITSSPKEMLASDAVILPGVGAFGDAMNALERLDLISGLRDVAASPKPLVGICLGMQLMMSESNEFGSHRGLGIIEGEVVRLEGPADQNKVLKVPQVGWNQISSSSSHRGNDTTDLLNTAWESPIFGGILDGEYMYFIHSFYAKPADASVVVSTTQYGETEFCSSLIVGSVFACQFHPERSGPAGLRVYQNLSKLIPKPEREQRNA